MLVFFPLCGGGGYTRRSTNWPAPTARPSRAQYTFDAHRDAKVSERHLHASAPQSMLSPCTPSAALPPLSVAEEHRCIPEPVNANEGLTARESTSALTLRTFAPTARRQPRLPYRRPSREVSLPG